MPSCVVTLMLILCLVLLSDGAKSRIKARRHVSDSKTEKFTIIIRTSKAGYLSDVFKQFMRLPVLDRIIVLWNGVDPVPDIGSRNIDVVFVPKAVDRVRNRLRRFTEIRTEGVLLLDDNHLYSVKDVEFAFRVWKRERNKLVGFSATRHIEIAKGVFEYVGIIPVSASPEEDLFYSLIVGSFFLHRDYLEIFNSVEIPQGVHELLDWTENCDDIAMNFMVGRHLVLTNSTSQCNLYVYPLLSSSTVVGKWEDPKQITLRSRCLNVLVSLYKEVPLSYCDMIYSLYSEFHKLKHCA